MAFSELERTFMLNASGQTRHLDESIKEEASLVKRIFDLNVKLTGIRINIGRIETALEDGIASLKTR